MVLVILGHAQIPYLSPFDNSTSVLAMFLYSFHIPLFMFLSGLCFSDRDIDFSKFFVKKFKSLVIPYIFFSIVSVAAQCFIDFAVNRSFTIYSFLNSAKDFAVQIRTHAIWFLACLFLLELLFYFVRKFSNNNTYIIIAFATVFFVCGIVYRKFVGVDLPWNIDLVPMLMPFFAAGYCAKKLINSKLVRKDALFFVLAVLINQGVNIINLKFFSPHHVDVFGNAYGNYLLFLVSAFSGIYATVLFCKYFDGKMKVFEYIGKNSLIFLGLHRFVFFAASTIFRRFNLSDPAVIACWLLTVIITLVVLTLVNEIIIRTPFKFVLGK